MLGVLGVCGREGKSGGYREWSGRMRKGELDGEGCWRVEWAHGWGKKRGS